MKGVQLLVLEHVRHGAFSVGDLHGDVALEEVKEARRLPSGQRVGAGRDVQTAPPRRGGGDGTGATTTVGAAATVIGR